MESFNSSFVSWSRGEEIECVCIGIKSILFIECILFSCFTVLFRGQMHYQLKCLSPQVTRDPRQRRLDHGQVITSHSEEACRGLRNPTVQEAKDPALSISLPSLPPQDKGMPRKGCDSSCELFFNWQTIFYIIFQFTEKSARQYRECPYVSLLQNSSFC